ncbi:MAG: hypothetical protein ACPF9K_06660 [Neptuniibacter sp.]
MGTDIEVTDRLVNTKEAFLGQEESQPSSSQSVLTLEKAFQATQGNRTPKLLITISLVVLVLTMVSAIFHYYMRTLENSVDIDVAEFEDVRLKEALFSLGNTSTQLDLMRSELKDMENSYHLLMTELNDEFDRREQLASLQGNLVQLEQIQMARKISVEHLNAEWNKNKTGKEEEIAALEARHQEAKRGLGTNAELLNPEQKLQSLKIQNVRNHYEAKIDQLQQEFIKQKKALVLKYNPEIEDSSLQRFLLNVPNAGSGYTFNADQVQQLNSEGRIDTDLLQEIQERSRDQARAVSELRAIPFINMPQVVTERLDNLNKSLSSSYVSLTDALLQTLQVKGNKVQSYDYMMRDMVIRAKSDGLIVDPRDEQNVIVHFREGYIPKRGDIFELYRYETALNMRLISYIENSQLLIRKEQSSSAIELLPFDKLVKVQE